MRLLAALLLAASLAIAASVAANTPLDLRTAGALPATVDLIVEPVEGRDLNAGFLRAGTYCVFIFCQEMPDTIFVWAGPDVPDHLVLAVFLHEVGHYHQSLEGVLPPEADVASEWDADRRAVRALCDLGLNGPALMAEALSWFWEDGYRGDPAHGHVLARIEHSLALRCGGGTAPDTAPQAQ